MSFTGYPSLSIVLWLIRSSFRSVGVFFLSCWGLLLYTNLNSYRHSKNSKEGRYNVYSSSPERKNRWKPALVGIEERELDRRLIYTEERRASPPFRFIVTWVLATVWQVFFFLPMFFIEGFEFHDIPTLGHKKKREKLGRRAPAIVSILLQVIINFFLNFFSLSLVK